MCVSGKMTKILTKNYTLSLLETVLVLWQQVLKLKCREIRVNKEVYGTGDAVVITSVNMA